jgi:hypothetical protein
MIHALLLAVKMLDHALEDLKCDYNCDPSGRSGSGVNLSNAFAVKAVSA